MDKRLIIITLMNLLFFQAVNAQFHLSEKKINKNKISKEILNYVEKNYAGSSPKYYELQIAQDSTLYEAKLKSDQGKIDLIFSDKGEFIRIDNEVDYHTIPREIKKMMNSQLNNQFSNYKITHCQSQRIMEQKTYEVDVRAKKKKYKFWFKDDGTLINYDVIPEKTIDFIFN